MLSTSVGTTLTECVPSSSQPLLGHGNSQATGLPSSQESIPTNTTSSNTNPRKRPLAANNLSRIAIGKLSSSNESLNSNSSGTTTNGQEASSEEVVEEPCTENWSDQQNKRFCAASSSLDSIVASSSSGPDDSPSSDEMALVECQTGGISTSGAKSVGSLVASSGLLISNGKYEIVGDGRECKAVDMHSKTIFHCLIMKPEEYKNFSTVLCRLKSAEAMYNDVDEYSTLKNLLIPDETQAMLGDNSNWYVLLPDHQGNLHSLVSSCSSVDTSPKVFSERRIQPIFKQIVTLVQFCHRIGIYFRDFRLRKFVFTDKERTRIRLNNVLDVWVAPQIETDQISQILKSQVCPVYISPEILVAGVYAGRPADVWALGVLLFSLLHGRYPFNDPNPTALFKRIKARRFSCPVSDSISHNARWLMYGLLHQSPTDRPTATEILQSHWLKTEAEVLPDGKECRSASSKGINSLSINSQSVFSSSTGASREGQPPSFVRMGGTMPLQQAAASSSTTAIHVRLTSVSTANQSSAPQLPPQLHREAPNYHLLPTPLDQLVDQIVPELRESNPPKINSSGMPHGLSTTISDHFYARGGVTNRAVLSLQSFPMPTPLNRQREI